MLRILHGFGMVKAGESGSKVYLESIISNEV